MPRSPSASEPVVVGYFEIASRTGVQRSVVTVWRTRHADFPEPLEELQIGPVWLWEPVKKYLVRHGRPTDEKWSWEQVMNRQKGSRPLA